MKQVDICTRPKVLYSQVREFAPNFSENHTETGSMVSADHCQSLDHNFIISVQPVIRNLRKRKKVNYSSNNNKKKTKKGGKRNRRKKKSHKRKRKTRKKRRKNKKKTKKRKN